MGWGGRSHQKEETCVSYCLWPIRVDYGKNHHNIVNTLQLKMNHQLGLDARDKCSGLVHWEDPEGGGGEGGGRGIGMGNTCKSMADSCQCVAKTTTIL